MYWKREKSTPEQDEELEGRVMKLLGIIYDRDGRGAAHPIGIAVPLDAKEKRVAAAASRLAKKGLVTVDRIGDIYITEAGVAWCQSRRENLR